MSNQLANAEASDGMARDNEAQAEQQSVNLRALRPGFPKSLEGGARAGDTLMQVLRANGLTTAQIKAVLATTWARKVLGKANGDRTQAIRELLAQPAMRSEVFMECMRRKPREGFFRPLSLEIPLLTSFANDWEQLRYDEQTLLACCDAWPAIHLRLRRRPGPIVPEVVQAFMAWPRIRAALEAWSTLDSAARTACGHACFALSSISTDDWFVRTAIELVPDLADDLGHLVLPNETAGETTAAPLATLTPEAQETTQVAISDRRGQATQTLDAEWAAIGEELASVAADWTDAPRRSVLARLIALGHAGERLIDLVPEDRKPVAEILHDAIDALRAHLMATAPDAPMDLLASDTIEQLMARWSLARAGALDETSLQSLADDVEQAHARVDGAMTALGQAHAAAEQARGAVGELASQIVACASALKRLELSELELKAREISVAAERARRHAMEAVLAAASPMAEAFNVQANYVAQWVESADGKVSTSADEQATAVESEVTFTGTDPAAAAAILELAAPLEDVQPHPGVSIDGPASVHPVDPELPMSFAADNDGDSNLGGLRVSAQPGGAEASGALPDAPIGPNPEPSLVPASVAAVFSPPAESAVFNASDLSAHVEDTSEALDCMLRSDVPDGRLVWQLLDRQRPALAYQAALALQDGGVDPFAPPPDLLRCLALVPALASSEGAVAAAIGEAFAGISAAWFEPGAAQADACTALNLLLIAGTLRPMVLAPHTGASAIAGYRHLDGRHSAVLQLAKAVAELSERLGRFSIGPAVLRSAADEATVHAQLQQLSKAASDWLHERAPSKKIRYAPASKVWLHWLKPGEPIHALMAPVANGAITNRAAVEAAAKSLCRYDSFLATLADTDRRKLSRPGPDIMGGALEHLWVATQEAVEIANGWLAVLDLLSESGDQLRSLVRQLQDVFQEHAPQACLQLQQPWAGDSGGIVRIASGVLFEPHRVSRRPVGLSQTG